MNLIISNLRIPVEKDSPAEYLKAAAEKLKIPEGGLELIRILSKSLDARGKKQFYYEMSIALCVPPDFNNIDGYQEYAEAPPRTYAKPKTAVRPIIIGFGPAGMFAALELIERGIKPVIFERGKKIEERSLDVQRFIKDRVLDPESNIQFGEGGAGSYSDGKLFSRMKNTEYVSRVLETFIKFGASPDISYISKPHLGTDVLCGIVRNIREYILEMGGEIHYSSKMTDLLVTDSAARGVVINGDREYLSSAVYLAVGHSARDVFALMKEKGVALEQKPISVGVRIEHPADTINLIRHGSKYKNHLVIGAASYSFTCNNRALKRGVFTFCMCPGGEVVNASTENGMLVLNGMSYSRRASAFSNSAIVVTCNTDDYGSADPLAGIEFQRLIERRSFAAGGGNWAVPAQNLPDYLAGKISASINDNSYKMGAVSADLRGILPEFVNTALAAAFKKWKEDEPLFVSEQAVLLGAETRTSAPVRISRGENYGSLNIKNLYPVGEGSGYTGGITSSAADAIKAVEITAPNFLI